MIEIVHSSWKVYTNTSYRVLLMTMMVYLITLAPHSDLLIWGDFKLLCRMKYMTTKVMNNSS